VSKKKSFKDKLIWLLKSPKFILYGISVAIVFAVLLFVVKAGANVNAGGILGMLARFFGIKKPKTNIEEANTISKKRVGKDGKIIKIGEEDVRKFKQVDVDALAISKNPLRDKSVVKIDGKELPLPVGVKDTDVKSVIILKPEVFVIRTTDDSLIKVKTEKTTSELLSDMPD